MYRHQFGEFVCRYWGLKGRQLVGGNCGEALCKRTQHCWLLHVASVCTPCWMLLHVVVQSLKLVKLSSQHLPTFLLFRDWWSVAQQCWIHLHSSSNVVGATHAHYALFTKTYGLYPSHDALQVPTLLGVVASICTPLPTCTQQLPTFLAQQCWELLHPFECSLILDHYTFLGNCPPTPPLGQN